MTSDETREAVLDAVVDYASVFACGDTEKIDKYRHGYIAALDAHEQALAGWQPIVTFTRSERTPILRHHKSWGTMVVMWLNNMWYSPGYTTMWPEDAFMPVWMPSPAPPVVTP